MSYEVQFSLNSTNHPWSTVALITTLDETLPSEGAAELEINERMRTHGTSRESYRIVKVGEDSKGLDMVDAPSHYTRLNPQPIEVISAWDLGFDLGSAVKYLARAGHKPGADAITDLRKAVSFIQHRIKTLETA